MFTSVVHYYTNEVSLSIILSWSHGNLFITSKELEEKFHQVDALEPQIKRPSQLKIQMMVRNDIQIYAAVNHFWLSNTSLDWTKHFIKTCQSIAGPKEAWEDHCIYLICDRTVRAI